LIIYEYPFNETVRSLLRLEYLFRRLDIFLQANDPEFHLTAISLIFEIGDVTSRADLKASLLKELERQKNLLISFRSDAAVDLSTLNNTISEIEECWRSINQLIGKPNTLINESEWLGIIRSRLNVPGGTSPIDIPSFYSWQQLDADVRREQLQSFMPAFSGWRATCQLYLRLLRQSGDSHDFIAENGSFQQMLSGRTYQLSRVEITQNDLIPEISANKHMLWIRFLQNSSNKKPQAITERINFKLMLCNL